MRYIVNNCYMAQVQSSSSAQVYFFKIKVKDRGVLNFPFFIMNHFGYACMGREGWYVPKCTVAYSQRGICVRNTSWRLLLKNFVYNSLLLIGSLIRRTFHFRCSISKRLRAKSHFLRSVKSIFSVALYPGIG